MMSTNSNRFKLQEFVEAEIGCGDHSKISDYKDSFERFRISEGNKERALNALKDDACDIYYKGALTYVEAVSAITRGYQSWAVVKLYYAVFYLLRCYFAAREVGVVKCKGIYTLKIEVGAGPVKQDGGKYKGEDVRGDHKTTICVFQRDIGAADKILSNSISEKTPLEWMMNARESVNYRHSTFHEPDFTFFNASLREENGAARWVRSYLEDEVGTHLFLEDHCCLAVPSYLLSEVRREFSSRLELDSPLTEEQVNVLVKSLAGTGLESDSRFLSLL